MATFTQWSDIYAITRLVITTRTTQPQTFVYGNGINQTEVFIHMNAVNQFNEEITGIPSEVLLSQSLLLDYIKGKVLLDATTVPLDQREATWSYSRVDNGYNVEAPSPPEFHSDTPSLPLNIDAAVATFFVMCGPDTPAKTLHIAVQVSLTHRTAPRKVYQTSITGTPEFESYITATALDPIDYSRAENRRVQQGVSTTVRNNIRWQSKSRTGAIELHQNGTLKRHYVKLSPMNASQFHRVENLSGTITSNDLSIQHVIWNEILYRGFGMLEKPYPIAVLGFSTRLTPYQVNYWYLNPPYLDIAGDYFGQERSSFNPVETMVTARLSANEVEVLNDLGALVCYKFTIPVNDQIPFGWSSAERYGMTLKLTDRYGNSGYVSLTLDTVDWFDTPRIS